MKDILNEVYEKSVDILKKNSTPLGLRAAAAGDKKVMEGYGKLWARDAFFASMGYNMLQDEKLLAVSRRTLDTFAKARNGLGAIPNNYDQRTGIVGYHFAGSVDASSLYIISLASLYYFTGDKTLLKDDLDAALDAYVWLRYRDVNNTMLINSPPTAEWMDTMVRIYDHTLYNNVLFYMAVKSINWLCEESGKTIKSQYKINENDLKERINEVFYPLNENRQNIFTYWKRVAESKDFDKLNDIGHYLNFISPNIIDDHFDTLSNMLCILSGLSGDSLSKRILSYVSDKELDRPYPVKSLYPPYRYNENFVLSKKVNDTMPVYWNSTAYNYHNGGIWPFVGGFYELALIKQNSSKKEKSLHKLAELNLISRYRNGVGFNEWLNGKSGKPMGQEGHSWNAGLYIAAYLYSTKGQNPFKFLLS
jgi:glycogen debranching enzyme